MTRRLGLGGGRIPIGHSLCLPWEASQTVIMARDRKLMNYN